MTFHFYYFITARLDPSACPVSCFTELLWKPDKISTPTRNRFLSQQIYDMFISAIRYEKKKKKYSLPCLSTRCQAKCRSNYYKRDSYNLGQNKMRNKTTPPPNSVMYSRYNENAPFFPSLKWGEGWS